MAFKIDIIGDIEGFWGIDYSTIQSQLDRANGEDVEIRLHSGGGSVIEGFAIRNALANYKGNVTVHIIGLAASIASIIPTGANEVTIQDGAFIMIHKATLWSSEPMNDEQLSNTSKTLEMFGDSLISTYTASAKKNGKLINNSEDETKTNFEASGDVSVTDVLIDSQRASVAFEATLQIRNKVLKAYQDVMSMPV